MYSELPATLFYVSTVRRITFCFSACKYSCHTSSISFLCTQSNFDATAGPNVMIGFFTKKNTEYKILVEEECGSQEARDKK